MTSVIFLPQLNCNTVTGAIDKLRDSVVLLFNALARH